MLVLSRRVGEKIYIGRNKEIEIVVTSIKGDQVGIGVQAAREVKIVRGELLERKEGAA